MTKQPDSWARKEAESILHCLIFYDIADTVDKSDIDTVASAILQAYQRGAEEERESILRRIEYCGFGSMEWRMKLIEKLKEDKK